VSKPSLIGLLIENLRGSVTPFNLPFEKNKTLTIIYGENGTGKSTVADAFDLLGNGNVGSLDTRGLGVTRKYWHSVGKAAADVKVTLETSSGNCVVSLGKNSVAVANETLRPQIAVLRRSQILQLIEANAADRYKAISRFVDVSGMEASESALRNLIRTKESEYNTATTRVAENRSEIARFWTQVGSPGSSANAWAGQEVQKDQSHLDKRKVSIDGLIGLWDRLPAHPQKVGGFVNQLKSAEEAQERALKELDALKDSVASDYLEVLAILKAAQAHFHKHPNPATCPLCESSEKVSGLAGEVNRRIQSQGLHSDLETAKNAVEVKRAAVQQAKQRVADSEAAAAADAAALEAYCNGAEVPADVVTPTFPLPADITAWGTWIAGNQDKRTNWAGASETCVDDKKFIGTLRTSLDALASNEKSAKGLEALLPRLKKTLELVERERKKFTDNILNAISTKVGELYETIHPGEGLKKIVLALDDAKRASLEIATEFGGKQDAPPQAYFSDSHLDTLGLCIFLALAERDTPGDKLLVLDDVLGSVDEPHVERVISMIYDTSQRFRHTVVTTHYRPWREKFRWGVLKPDQVCHFVELNRWTFDKGISLSGAIIPEIARLKTLLADTTPDIQSITGKAGVILEALLDFITLQYGCAVPRRHGNAYVLSDLLGAVNGKLLVALKAETLGGGQVITATELKPILDQIGAVAQARNVLGAHFNPAAFELYPTEGIRFAKLVEQLCDALVCPDHGHPVKDTGSYWRNGGDTRRLHPLKKPS
jgi:AAA domain